MMSFSAVIWSWKVAFAHRDATTCSISPFEGELPTPSGCGEIYIFVTHFKSHLLNIEMSRSCGKCSTQHITSYCTMSSKLLDDAQSRYHPFCPACPGSHYCIEVILRVLDYGVNNVT